MTETAHELAPVATARVVAKRIAKQSSPYRTALAAALNIALPANATARANAATLAQAALVAVIGGRKNADLLALVAVDAPVKKSTKGTTGPSKTSVVIVALVQGATLAQLVKLIDAGNVKAAESTVRTIISDIRSEKWGGSAIRAVREAGRTVERDGDTYRIVKR